MGGGGLDYYDTAHARAARRRADSPTRQLAEKIAEAKKACAKAKAEFDAIRGTPEGLKPGAERPAEAAAVPAEDDQGSRPSCSP